MDHIKLPVSSAIEPDILRVLSYNVQVGIRTTRPRHYLTGSWKHIFPHSKRLVNLNEIASIINSYDIVGLQEVDAGSLRSNFINLTEYLAERSGFPHWYHQVNRNLGKVAQHSNGLLSHFRPNKVRDIRLPGLIPGRQAILASYGQKNNELAVFVLHMALSRRARLKQFDYISDLVNQYPHVIMMGDLNCRHDSREMQLLFKRT
ncbi:MAG: endonuclease/exonuclease/phosphatase family protein, partial [Thioalkalispiraceae bacterium]